MIARLLFLVLLVAAAGAQAGIVELSGSPVQGGMMLGRTQPGATVELDGRRLRLDPEGRFVFGFGRDFKGPASLAVTLPDGTGERRELTVAGRDYEIQRIDGLPSKMVTPPEALLVRIRREAAAVAAVRRRDSDLPWFALPFAWPARGVISGVYGSQRVLNGEPRRPHFGVDVAGPVGTPVVAAAGGEVVMAEPDLYYTGGTVIIDHGHGLSTAYSHLSAVDVTVGQRLAQGERIGAIGATGRATGPHLDWRLNWFEERLDPALLVGPMPK